MGKILKLAEEPMILYLARLPDIKMNNNAIPDVWRKAITFHV